MECDNCNFRIPELSKLHCLARGKWVPSSEITSRRSAQLSALYAPWERWGEVAAAFLEVRHFPERLRDWLNSKMAEPWEQRAQSLDEDTILSHKLDYPPGVCPAKVAAIILTADVQADRCYYVIRAWQNDESSFLLRYGQVATIEDVATIARTPLKFGEDAVFVTHGFVDSGYNPKGKSSDMTAVYDFCRRFGFCPTKGFDVLRSASVYSWSRAEDLPLLNFATDATKDLLHLRFEIKPGDPGFWGLHNETGMDFARQIAAEAPVEKLDQWGVPRRHWKRFHNDNHYLDCETQNLASAIALGVRYVEAAAPPTRNSGEVLRPDGRPWLPPLET